jgi:hypothetical protein
MADFDHTPTYIGNRVQNTDHIAHRVFSIGSQDEIRTGQDIEVQDVLFHIGDAVAQAAEFFTRWWQLYTKDSIGGFGRCQVVGPGADAADAGRDARHLLDRFTNAKALKTAQLNDVDHGVSDVTSIIKFDRYLGVTFNAANRLYD